MVFPAAGRFTASTFWQDCVAHGATFYTAVPTIHQVRRITCVTGALLRVWRVLVLRRCRAQPCPAVVVFALLLL